MTLIPEQKKEGSNESSTPRGKDGVERTYHKEGLLLKAKEESGRVVYIPMNASRPKMEEAWLAPTKTFAKKVLKKGSGFETPQEGATCLVRVLDDSSGVLQGVERQLVLGEAECKADYLLELCLRTMRQEEECEFYLLKSALVSTLQPDVKLVHRTQPQAAQNAIQLQHENIEEKPEEESPGPLKEGGDTNIHDSTDSEEIRAGSIDEVTPPTSQQEGEEACSHLANAEEATKEEQPTAAQKSISENDFVKTIILLDSFTREPEIWEMSITEKSRRFNHHKDRGVELYAQKEYEWAFLRFSKAIKYLISVQYEIPEEDQLPPELGLDMKMACYLNLAACQLKHRNYDHAVVNCTKALEIDPDNPKALYRRGTGYIHLQEYERAKLDLDKALELEPNRKAIQRQQIILKARVQKLNQRDIGDSVGGKTPGEEIEGKETTEIHRRSKTMDWTTRGDEEDGGGIRRELGSAKSDVAEVSQSKRHCRRSDSFRTPDFISRVPAVIDEDAGKSMRALARALQVDEATILRLVQNELVTNHSDAERTVHVRKNQGARVNAVAYIEVLATVAKPISRYCNTWETLQDSAPSHTARTTQEWMAENLHDHVTPNIWPPSSPDVNPLDYGLLRIGRSWEGLQ
ncbi:FKBPL [Cordylochernes scorpioides]|uniref:FKBPL n=1 Tax=Cordylochernes scorpioides TaxID=51811 RepID=A0ABY6K571_9ARAC|nr:FKBPL [Cordylochernes scorpioides]